MTNINELSKEEKELFAIEALLKRIAHVNLPFVLKGSLLTRQFLEDRKLRDVQDIDFLYKNEIDDAEKAYTIFTDWMTQATEMDLQDGVLFESFREEGYWDSIDYAMADDFPTVNTDIIYRFKNEAGELSGYEFISLDVSFNLETGVEPVPFEYESEFFGNFLLPYTAPLSLQIAWKLHQTIVRPRFKDLYDLKYLLSHPSYNEETLKEMLQALGNECSFDRSVTKDEIRKVLVDNLYNLLPSLWYDGDLQKYAGQTEHDVYFKTFAAELRTIMDNAGINQTAFDHLPNPK